MADTHSALEQLADISEPVLSSVWPLAPIWWLVIVSVCLFLTYAMLRLYWRWQFFKAKRQALLLLKQMADKPDATELNRLIKRVLKHYQPEHPALSMSSQQWQRWLGMQQDMPLPDLNSLLYQPPSPDTDTAIQDFYQFTKLWLAQYNADASDSVSHNGVHHA